MTIKLRLILISIGAVLLGVSMYGLLMYSLNKAADLKESQRLVTQLEESVLMLRRAEKDFMLDLDAGYVEKHAAQLTKTGEYAANLKQLLEANGIGADSILSFNEAVNAYANSFQKLVKMYEEVGLNPNLGLQKDLRDAVHKIEGLLLQYNEIALKADMLMLRRDEKDFLLRMDIKYVERFNKDIEHFKADIENSALTQEVKQDIFQLLLGYQQSFNAMVKGYLSIGLNKNEGLQGQMRDAVHQTDQILAQLIVELEQILESELSAITVKASAVALVLILLILIVSVSTTIQITRSVKSLSDTILRVNQQKDFSIRSFYNKKDEIKLVSDAFNALLSDMQTAIDESNLVVNAIAEGDFTKLVKSELVGDLGKLKQGVNNSAHTISAVMFDLEKAMDTLKNGEFSLVLETQANGGYKRIIESASGAMQALNESIADVNKVMAKMQEGEFNYRVEVQARGDLAKLKNSINASVESISLAISKITEVVSAQAAGDLTVKLPSAEFRGELHKLSNSINDSMDKLNEVVEVVSQAANTVNGAAYEVSQGSLSLSQRVQEQAAALEQTSATMDEMNSVVQSNTDNARQTAKVAQEVQAQAHQGATVMKQTIEAMNSIQESSNKIAEIVTLIDGIAFQTNLLALNAAVEAARAGDHGRGFAVVAGEVRALAQKSAEAAKDIKSLIDESVVLINGGSQLASESGEKLQDINESINSVSEMISQIASASGEQSEGIKQVHMAISQIDSVTQQNAALVEETNAASESLSEQASVLQERMAFFKTTKSSIRLSQQRALPKL